MTNGFTKITYNGAAYFLPASDETERTVAQIEAALKEPGDLITLNATTGLVQIGITLGVPITIEHVDTVDESQTIFGGDHGTPFDPNDRPWEQ
jgi:hypothetical protein